jgi:hypothetical protein
MANKKRTLIISGSVVVIGGVVGYFVWKWWKNKKSATTPTDESTTSPPTSSGSPSPSYSSSRPTDKTGITAFQIYAKSKGANLGKSGKNKDGIDGVWGQLSENAWLQYGDMYTKAKNYVSPSAKVLKVYANSSNTAIWKNLNDLTPYRLANYNEYVGNAKLNVEGKIDYATSESGNSFIPVMQTDGVYFIRTKNAKFNNK